MYSHTISMRTIIRTQCPIAAATQVTLFVEGVLLYNAIWNRNTSKQPSIANLLAPIMCPSSGGLSHCLICVVMRWHLAGSAIVD